MNKEMIGTLDFSEFYINESSIYSIKASNGKYIGITNDGVVRPNRINVDAQERFKIEKNDDGTYSLLSLSNSRYIGCHNSNKPTLLAINTTKGEMEKFSIIANSDSTVSFKSNFDSKFVSNEKNELLTSKSPTIGDLEKFRISKIEVNKETSGDINFTDFLINGKSVYAIKSFANNQYLSATNNGNSPLKACSIEVTKCEKFLIEKNDDGTYSLKALCNSKYVCAEEAGLSPLIASRKSNGEWGHEWTRFNIFVNNDGTVSFQSMANSKYVCTEGGAHHPLIANRNWIGPWEKFNIYKIE